MVSKDHHHNIEQQIKGYTILRKLAGGGSAHVYLAQNNRNDSVAIKILDSKYLKSKRQQHFLQEAQFLQELKHCHYILPILDYGESNGTPYIVTEYAPGGTLREYINAFGPLTVDEALTISEQVGEAIHTAHQYNIVHRDLKPENILFDKNNNAVLADFGIAVRLRANEEFHGDPCGTHAYMAPEQFDGKFTKEADQYALGCIAYELLTGKHPFEHLLPFDPHNRKLMQERHRNAQPHPLHLLNRNVSRNIEQTILQALAKKPSERYASIASFIRSLQLSVSFTSQSTDHSTQTLYTPPPDTSALGEPPQPPDPPQDHNSSPVPVEVYETVRPKESHSKVLRKSERSNVPIPSFSKNPDKYQTRNTEHFDDAAFSHAEISKKTKQSKKETKQPKKEDPIKSRDLRLLDDWRKLLSPPLEALGLTLSDEVTQSRFRLGEKWQYTAIKNNFGQSHPLAYIPQRYFDNGTNNNEAAIRRVFSLFPNSTLIIFSDSKKYPDPLIQEVMKDEEKTRNIKMHLVPQQNITQLENLNDNDMDVRKLWVTNNLPIQALLQNSTEVSDADIGILEGTLTQYLVINDDVDMRRVLLDLGLSKIAGHIGGGSTTNVVCSAIRLINDMSPNQRDETGHTFLGLILCYFLALQDFSPKYGDNIRRIIRQYKLGPSNCNCNKQI